MKENRVRKKYAWLVAAFCMMAVCLCTVKTEISAAAETQTPASFTVRINYGHKAILEKEKDGWYLRSDEIRMSALKSDERVVYLSCSKKNSFTSGYYYFDSKNRLDTRKAFHMVSTTAAGEKLEGNYYFGEENGRLRRKAGWVTYKGVEYAIDENGRMCSSGDTGLSALKTSLLSVIKSCGGRWSVYVKDLKTGDVLNINDTAMYPASVIKLFVMEATYKQISDGKLTLNSRIKSLLNDMITVSDNEAYNELVRQNGGGDFRKGRKNINRYLKKCGYTNTEVHTTLQPSSSASVYDGSSNKSSAKDAGILLEKIYRKNAVTRKYSGQMLNLLLHQTRRLKIPAGLPSGIKVANKTGETNSCQHDAAIVFGRKTDYVAAIYSTVNEYDGIRGIKALSSRIYNYLN